MPFRITTRVYLQSNPARIGVIVSDPKARAGNVYYDVAFGGATETYREDQLCEYSGLSDIETIFNDCERWGDKQALTRIVTFFKLQAPLRDVLYSFRATRTQFQAFQFKPLVKLLDSANQRLLIADEVGLGKTIEAGYIIRELKAREPASFRRILVLCPAALRQKWQREMAEKFDERFDVLDSSGVHRGASGRNAASSSHSHDFQKR